MRPRSNIERKLVEMAGILPPPDKAVLEWGKERFKPEAYYWQHRGNKQEIWCQCCGHREPCDSWLHMTMDFAWTCPECGAVCMIKNMKDRASYTALCKSIMVSVVDVFQDMQVVRTFEVFKENDKDHKPTEYYMKERYQNWVLEKGREVITSRPYSRGWNFMQWENTGYVIQRHNGHCNGYYSYEDLYAIEDNFIYPKMRIAPGLRKKGVTIPLMRMFFKAKCTPTDAVAKWIGVPYYETLWKAGEKAMFWHFMNSHRKLSSYKDSIRIARRHGYTFPDIGMWLDYVDELRELGMDVRSPHYLCPDDLRKAHEITSRRIERKRAVEQEKAEQEKIYKAEKAYGKHIAPYLALCFVTDDIEIRVLPTVKDVYNEGQAMHHCIYRMGYYKRKDTLLMSARSRKSGKRIESIEVSLRNYRIEQSRGLQNQNTIYHDKIVRLVEQNMGQIKSIRTAI